MPTHSSPVTQVMNKSASLDKMAKSKVVKVVERLLREGKRDEAMALLRSAEAADGPGAFVAKEIRGLHDDPKGVLGGGEQGVVRRRFMGGQLVPTKEIRGVDQLGRQSAKPKNTAEAMANLFVNNPVNAVGTMEREGARSVHVQRIVEHDPRLSGMVQTPDFLAPRGKDTPITLGGDASINQKALVAQGAGTVGENRHVNAERVRQLTERANSGRATKQELGELRHLNRRANSSKVGVGQVIPMSKVTFGPQLPGTAFAQKLRGSAAREVLGNDYGIHLTDLNPHSDNPNMAFNALGGKPTLVDFGIGAETPKGAPLRHAFDKLVGWKYGPGIPEDVVADSFERYNKAANHEGLGARIGRKLGPGPLKMTRLNTALGGGLALAGVAGGVALKRMADRRRAVVERAAADELRARLAARGQMRKTAGEYDEDAMRELGKKARPGDVLSWEVPAADAYRKGLRHGAMTDAISGSIRAVTSSPISHTALIHSIDPDTGIPNIVHNFEGNKMAKIESLRRYADTNVMHIARPNISEDQAREAVDRAVGAVERQVKYPKRDLALMVPGEAAKRVGLEGVARQANRVGTAIARVTGGGRHCDPASGVCSAFVSHALAPAFGSEEAAQRALGGVGGGRLGLTPADIFNASRDPSNTAIHEIASYRPKNRELSRVGGALQSAIDRLKKIR